MRLGGSSTPAMRLASQVRISETGPMMPRSISAAPRRRQKPATWTLCAE
jgi:hypothetical protein